MRLFTIPLLASIVCASCGQRTDNQSGASPTSIDSTAQHHKADSFQFNAKPDSIIERRQHGYVYVTTDTTSRLYDWIIPDPNNEYVKDVLAQYIDHIKTEYKQKINSHDLKGFPRKWNSVHVLKNQYYLYGPSDWMSNSGYYVSDSVIYITKSDPDDLFVIRDIEKKNAKSAIFKIINYAGDYQTIKVQRVDADYGLYVWTFSDQQNQIEARYLMQDSDYANKLPMIVCDCGDEKCYMEFKFDEPEFDKLVNQ